MDEWSGLSEGVGITIVRPLLAIRHAEAQAHCEQVGLAPRFDRSNLDKTFFRNRIRHQLLPILEQYNPGLRGVIHNLGEVMRSEVEFMRGQVDLVWPSSVEVLNPDAIILRGATIRELPLALQRHIMKRAIKKLRPDARDLGFDQIERLRLFLLDPDRPSSSAVVADLLAHDCADDVLVTGAAEMPLLPDFPQISGEVKLDFPPPEHLELANGWHISISMQDDVSMEDIEVHNGAAWDVYLDLDSIGKLIVFRSRQPGDLIQPLGMQGRMKVSDLMINRKVPRLARENWPLLISQGDVAWVPGLHVAHPFRVTADTHNTLRLAVKKPRDFPP
jgi:tRNA(Ile)-lysidine synthase